MTAQQTVKLVSATAAVLDGVLAYADTIKAIPSLPGWLVHSYVLIFIFIMAVDRGLHAYLGDAPQTVPPPKAL
jgi:thiamine transporter ThiT